LSIINPTATTAHSKALAEIDVSQPK